jgi:hypothetical protein
MYVLNPPRALERLFYLVKTPTSTPEEAFHVFRTLFGSGGGRRRMALGFESFSPLVLRKSFYRATGLFSASVKSPRVALVRSISLF